MKLKVKFITSIFTLIILSSCGGGEDSNNESKRISDPRPPEKETTDLFSKTSKVDSNCLNNKNYHSCLLVDDLVSEKRGAVPSYSESIKYLQKNQVLGIKVDILNEVESLTTKNFSIVNDKNEVIQNSINWNVQINEENKDKLSQLASFYFTYITLEKLKMYDSKILKDYNLKINPLSRFTGLNHDSNTIYIGKKEGSSLTNGARFDPTILIHLIGTSVIRNVQKNPNPKDDEFMTNHVGCGLKYTRKFSFECCRSSIGCEKAIKFSLSDYLVKMILEKDVKIAQILLNDADGMKYCDLPRETKFNPEVTPEKVFNTCSDENVSKGHYRVMSIYFTSYLSGVLENIKKVDPLMVDEFNKVIVHSFKRLEVTDTFESFKEKLKEIALDITKSRSFAELFVKEVEEDGFNINI